MSHFLLPVLVWEIPTKGTKWRIYVLNWSINCQAFHRYFRIRGNSKLSLWEEFYNHKANNNIRSSVILASKAQTKRVKEECQEFGRKKQIYSKALNYIFLFIVIFLFFIIILSIFLFFHKKNYIKCNLWSHKNKWILSYKNK